MWRCARPGCNLKTSWTPHCADRIKFGPCNGLPFPHELGHWIALVLEAFFLTKSSWLRLKILSGFKPVCGCQKREESLNSLGKRLAALVAAGWVFSRALPLRAWEALLRLWR